MSDRVLIMGDGRIHEERRNATRRPARELLVAGSIADWGAEVMKLVDVEVGQPGPGQVRVRQTAVGRQAELVRLLHRGLGLDA